MDDSDPWKADVADVNEARIGIGGDDVDKDDGAVQREVQTALTTLAQFRGDVGCFLESQRLDGVIAEVRMLLLTSAPSLMAKSHVGMYDTVWMMLYRPSGLSGGVRHRLSTPIRNAWPYGMLVDIADRSRLSAALAVALGPACEVGRAFASATHHAMTLVRRLQLESALENDYANGRRDVSRDHLDEAVAKGLLFGNDDDDDDDLPLNGVAKLEQSRQHPNALVDGLRSKRRRYGLLSPGSTPGNLFIMTTLSDVSVVVG